MLLQFHLLLARGWIDVNLFGRLNGTSCLQNALLRFTIAHPLRGGVWPSSLRGQRTQKQRHN